jgi:hypothetical protein
MVANREIDTLRESLRRDPTNLGVASRYWNALGNVQGHDVRSGRDVVDVFGAAALSSIAGTKALTLAFRQLFEKSGESPRPVFFDQKLVRALKLAVSESSGQDASNLRWILKSIGLS